MTLKPLDECISYCENKAVSEKNFVAQQSNLSVVMHLLSYKKIDDFLSSHHFKKIYDYILIKSSSRDPLLEIKIKEIREDLEKLSI